MTDHRGPIPVPARITVALDSIGAEGPWVDEALGGQEPMVDQWEAGELVPTRTQIEKLAKLTDFPIEWFYRPADELGGPMRLFICERHRRGENGLTVLDTHIDWAGVLHVQQLTPDRPLYRPPKPRTPDPKQAPGAHDPVEDPDAPGCCLDCHLPLDRPNAKHLKRTDQTGRSPGRP
jgi:hypothetical protein